MGADASQSPAPRSCHARDLAALIGLLAVLEGQLMVDGAVPERLAGRIRGRFERAGLLAPGGDAGDLRRAINGLNHRLRYALGEYPEPPR
ncbi:hypothetical protein [Dactylosporangium salmoneum]|uniref:hypothetical protein n=1 Tax=Dactylosporangium salmoneum TaxID=53361 RepID=UPI0031D5723C